MSTVIERCLVGKIKKDKKNFAILKEVQSEKMGSEVLKILNKIKVDIC